MSEPTTNTSGKAASNGRAETNGHAQSNSHVRKTGSRKAAQQDLTTLIEQAEKIRTATHDLMHLVGGLVNVIKPPDPATMANHEKT